LCAPMPDVLSTYCVLYNLLTFTFVLHLIAHLDVLDPKASTFLLIHPPPGNARAFLLGNRLIVLLLLLRRGMIIMHGDLLPKRDIDILQAPLLCLREEEIHIKPVDRRRDDEDQEELPADLVQRDRARHKQDYGGEVEADHADGHAGRPEVRGEDLAEVEVLRRVDAGAPEADEEEDEEDGGFLTRRVGAAEVFGLQGDFEDEADEDAGEAGEEEFAPADWRSGVSLLFSGLWHVVVLRAYVDRS